MELIESNQEKCKEWDLLSRFNKSMSEHKIVFYLYNMI